MTNKTTNKFSTEVRTRAVRMVLDHEAEHRSRWAAITSIADKIGCVPQTLNEWKEDYNTQRPHSSLGNITPNEFAMKMALQKQAA